MSSVGGGQSISLPLTVQLSDISHLGPFFNIFAFHYRVSVHALVGCPAVGMHKAPRLVDTLRL